MEFFDRAKFENTFYEGEGEAVCTGFIDYENRRRRISIDPEQIINN